MNALCRIALSLSAMVLAAPTIAQSTGFDGTHQGPLPRTGRRPRLTNARRPQSYTLTIAEGVGHMRWAPRERSKERKPGGRADKDTTAATFILHLDAKIDPSGAVSAGVGDERRLNRMASQKNDAIVGG